VIVIGLVVHRSRRAVFAAAAGALTGVALEWVEYEYENDMRRLVQELLDRRHVDGLVLGPVPYQACRDLLPDRLCVALVEPTELDLALAFSRAAIRACTSGRRSGGTVAGGWRRGGSVPSRACTSAVTFAIACSYASSTPAGGFCSPETFRMNCRAAASTSSSVAGGCRPRSSVMFRHIRS